MEEPLQWSCHQFPALPCLPVYERYEISDIKNGYYYFLDRHSESKDRYDSSDLNNRFSWNFTLALLDVDKNIIYYYELDT